MRIAFFSPLHPCSTGIADYSEEILPHLAQHVDVDVYVDGYEPSNLLIRDMFPVYDVAEFEERNSRRPYDILLYQIGNDRSHSYAYRLLRRYPGVVVLHDFVLHHFLGAAFLEHDGDIAAYCEAFQADVGEGLLRRRTAGLWSDVDHFVFPGIDRIVESSRALIVHSQTTADNIQRSFPQACVHVVPHHIGPDRSPFQGMSTNEVKAQFGLPTDALVVATFGFITPSKRFESALLAFRELLVTHPSSRYLVVGAENPYYDLGAVVRELGLEGLVYILGRVSWEFFYGLMDAVDICVQLRYPSAGEMSGAILRVMSKGRPVVLSNYAQFSEFPDDCCLKVDLGPAEVPMITNLLRLLADDKALRRHIGENARQFVSTHNSIERTIQGYVHVLEEVMRADRGDVSQRDQAMTKSDEGWLDVPALMAAIRRELARQLEEGSLSPYEREHYQAIVTDWIMEEIRHTLAERWDAGELIAPDLGPYHTFDESPEELTQSLKELNTRWKQSYSPPQLTRRTPVLGSVWMAMRQRIHEEVRSYLEPLIWQQNDVNAAIVRSLNALTTALYGGSLQRSVQALYQEVVGLSQRVQQMEDRAGGSRTGDDPEEER